MASVGVLCAMRLAAQVTIPPRPPVPGQPPARDAAASVTGTARIRGRVVTTDTSSPLRNVQIALTGGSIDPRAPRTATTDQQGRYEIADVPAGRFVLSASKAGYLTLAYGQRRPRETGTPVELARDQTLENIDFGLPKSSAITVRVTNEFGEPATGVAISAQQYGYSDGERRLVMTARGEPVGYTDDLGELRIHTLPPGEYYVSARMSALGAPGFSTGRADRVYADTYFPGTTSASEARAVSIGVAQEANVTFPLVVSRPARVSGIVRFAEGSSIADVRLSLDGRNQPLGSDGTFVLTDVPAGDHQVYVSGPAQGGRVWGLRRFTMSGDDVSGLELTAVRAGSLRGRMVFESGETPRGLQPGSVRLSAFPSPGASADVRWSADWTFAISDGAGAYLFRTTDLSSGFAVKAVMYGGKDVIDTPIDVDSSRQPTDVQVIVTSRLTEVSGRVTDAGGNDLREYVTVLFPEDRAQWTVHSRFIATARPDQQGRFRVAGLPAGRYLAAAVEYVEPGEERHQAFLDRLARNATPLQLVEGETKAVNLRMLAQ